MEEKGSGFDKIESDYESYGEEYKPYVSADSQSFTLTLPDLTSTGDRISDESVQPEVYAEIALEGKNDLNILSFCYNASRSIREVAEYIGVTPSTYFRSKVIARLVSTGLLKEVHTENGKKLITNKEKVFLKSTKYR